MEPQQMTPTIPPQPPIPVEQKPASSNKTFKILLLVFLVLLLGAVTTYAFQNYQQPPQSNLLPLPEDVQSPTPEESDSWQTYKNDEYGFEFEYPFDYKVATRPTTGNQFMLTIISETDTDETGFVPIQFMINTATDEKGDSLTLSSIKQAESHYSKSFTTASLVREDITIDAQPAVNISGLTKGPGPGEGSSLSYTFIKLNSEVLVIQLGDKNYQNALDQILSSFRFVGEEDLKSYKNEEFGFEFKYPASYQFESLENSFYIMETEAPDFTRITSLFYISVVSKDHPALDTQTKLLNLSIGQSTTFESSEPEGSNYGTFTRMEDITIADQEAAFFENKNSSRYEGTVEKLIFIPKGEDLFLLGAYTNTQGITDEEFYQMAKSLKFLE